MGEELTREGFRAAVADAVKGVLNVCHEVDVMLRELGTALSDGEPSLRTVVDRVIPNVSRKNPDTRWLRGYQASVFGSAGAVESEDDDDEGEGDDDDDEDGSVEADSKRTIKVGAGIVIARASIYDRMKVGFEPNLAITTFLRCRLDTDLPLGTPLKFNRSRVKKLLKTVEGRNSTGMLQTTVSTHPIGQPKLKQRMRFDIPSVTRVIPLFEISPSSLLELAAAIRADWSEGVIPASG